ncbi:MAG: hypothetical protein ACOCP8_00545 [archaeon]
MHNKWTYILYAIYPWENELFDDKEKAIKEGKKIAKKEGAGGFFIGCTQKPVIKIDGHDLLENVYMQLNEEVGDNSQKWYKGITKKDKDKLTSMLNATFQKWMNETENNINCYKVENIEYIKI